MQTRRTFGLECPLHAHSVKPGSPCVIQGRGAADDLASRAASYIIKHLPAMDAGAQQWGMALARPALPLVLQLLGGLAKGDEGIQQAILSVGSGASREGEESSASGSGTSALMTRLHALERQSSSASKAIGTLAESLLEALRERAAADVDQLRQATQEAKRKAARDKRAKILQSMGMGIKKPPPGAAGGTSSSGGKVIVATTMALEARGEARVRRLRERDFARRGRGATPAVASGCSAAGWVNRWPRPVPRTHRRRQLGWRRMSRPGRRLGDVLHLRVALQPDPLQLPPRRDARGTQPEAAQGGVGGRDAAQLADQVQQPASHPLGIGERRGIHALRRAVVGTHGAGRPCRRATLPPRRTRSQIAFVALCPGRVVLDFARAEAQGNIKMVPYLIKWPTRCSTRAPRLAPLLASAHWPHSQCVRRRLRSWVEARGGGSRRRRRQHSDGGGDSARGRQRHQR